MAGLLLLAIAGAGECLSAAQVTLMWDFNTEPNIAGYKAYYGTPPGGYYSDVVDVGNTNSATITDLVPGVTYWFYVTCYNTFALESEPSGVVEYNVPRAPDEGGEPPVATSLTLTNDARVPLVIRLTGFDPESQPLRYEIASFPRFGYLQDYTPETVTYFPTADYAETDGFTFIVTDGFQDSAPAEVTLVMAAPPRITGLEPLPAGGWRLTWASFPGRRYQVMTNRSLDPKGWSAAAPELTTTTTTTQLEVLPPASSGQAFFVVALLP